MQYLQVKLVGLGKNIKFLIRHKLNSLFKMNMKLCQKVSIIHYVLRGVSYAYKGVKCLLSYVSKWYKLHIIIHVVSPLYL